MIKQEIPKGWVRSPLNRGNCEFSGIEYKVIVTGWLWRHRHANAVKTVIIKEGDLPLANRIKFYYKKYNVEQV